MLRGSLKLTQYLLLDSQPGGRILREDPAQSYITAQRRDCAMAGLLHDHELIDAVHRGLRDHAGPKTVSSDRLRLHVRTFGGSFQNDSKRVAIKCTLRDLTMTAHSAEDIPFLNAGRGEPRT